MFSYNGSALATIATEWIIFSLILWWAQRHILSINRQYIHGKFIAGIVFATILMCIFFKSTQLFKLDRIVIYY